MVLLAVGACSKKTVSFNSKPEQLGLATLTPDSLTSSSDTTKARRWIPSAWP
ncbi:hypothetical protein [Hymenobacter cellulosivorans]|uniref:Uncharacterized protein n=1 Tax=Hymenobacter cellulosivorans TaxID=2932249 RepID=A0ABY4FCQ7_9BACT|nr:hypothetical protein [Hymenobacter cellulosivorans]UOQ54443.1 hypothetical protein MUN80_06695 [Hymenobacter cellulosivorans]